MDRPNFYITEEGFQALIGAGYWAIQDLPAERAEMVRPFLNNPDTFGVFASGMAPRQAESDSAVVGGIDWVRLESNRKPDETSLNVYHYVIGKPNTMGYPVYVCKEGKSIARHWSELVDLDVYFEP